MALNIAVPLSGVEGFYEGFGLLSPISPISLDCREQLKVLVSPVDSESSGVSSLDSEDLKKSNVIKQKPTPTQSSTPIPSPLLTDNEGPTLISSSPITTPSPTSVLITAPQDIETPKAVHAEKVPPATLASPIPSDTKVLAASPQPEEAATVPEPSVLPPASPPKRLRYFSGNYDHSAVAPISYGGRRDILELGDYLKNEKTWQIQYAVLPSNNLPMFLTNRSQYHRLGARGHAQEFYEAECNKCGFRYPINQSLCNEIKPTSAIQTPVGQRPKSVQPVCNTFVPQNGINMEVFHSPPSSTAFNRAMGQMRPPQQPMNNQYGYYGSNNASYNSPAISVGGGQQQNMQYGNNFWQSKPFGN